MPAPFRIGILNDMSAGPPGPASIVEWLQVAFDELRNAGTVDRDIEFVHAWGLGLPEGTAAAVERGFRELASQDVLAIIGPAIGDNALVATPLAEEYRIPTINWAGTERARGEHMFHLQVGSHEDEPYVLASHIAETGAGPVGVVYDNSPIGKRYFNFFLQAAESLGLEVAASASIPPLAEYADKQVQGLCAQPLAAVVYLGLGIAAPAVASALRGSGWQGETLMNSAGIRGYQPGFADIIDGWIYVDMFSDNNQVLIDLRERCAIPETNSLAAAKGYDLGRLMAWGLARAPEVTREGVREGLEQVKWLPAAEGKEGTVLAFGHRDRGALHGRYLVLRRWVGGVSEELGSRC